MNTKPIDDTLEPTLDHAAINVGVRTALDESSNAAADRPGPALLDPVAEAVSTVAATSAEELAVSDAADPPAKQRVARFEFLPHRFAGRRVLNRRR